jgi:conjugal transfer pilus assembly protein TraB
MAEEKKKGLQLTVLHKQIVTGAAFVGIAIIVIAIIVLQINKSPAVNKSEEKVQEKEVVTKEIETAGEQVDEQEVWRHKMKRDQENIKGELDMVKEAVVNAMNKSKSKIEGNDRNDELEAQIAVLQERVEELSLQKEEKAEDVLQQDVEKIKKIKINLSEKNETNKKDIMVTSGSFARAQLLGGVDASTSLTSAADPRPLLIRLIDYGVLPRKIRSDVKDCHIIASGYGDLSSERVFVRLEKMTCTSRKNGEVMDIDVSGYVAGEDGRAGIKGEVIEKGRGYIGKSVLGGVLQGVAGILQPAQNTVINPAGALIEKRSLSNKFGEGIASGAGGSMDRLSKYYIERAESIQPIIRVSSGREVDVIFTEKGVMGVESKNNEQEE